MRENTQMPLMLALACLVVLLDASQVFADCVLVFTEKTLMEIVERIHVTVMCEHKCFLDGS